MDTFHVQFLTASNPIAASILAPTCANPSADPRHPGVKSITDGAPEIYCGSGQRLEWVSKCEATGIMTAESSGPLQRTAKRQ